MSTIFNEFPEIPQLSLEENVEQMKNSDLEKKLKKRLKKQKKCFKKHLKEFHRQQDLIGRESANTKSKPFFDKAGDALLKSIPGILTIAATSLIGFYLKPKKN